jgi:N-acetyl-anhydromuramyl-L-alanine amidase AmpD
MAQRQLTDLIVFHCSATRPSQDIGRREIEEWHVAKGWTAIGYHFVIRRDGRLELGRPMLDIGAHVEGFNSHSVGVCMVGGLLEDGSEEPNGTNKFTPQQWATAILVRQFLWLAFPGARVVGHRDLSPDSNHDGKIQPREWLKTCPAFDVASVLGV